ncbi:MAG TPA: hypothetical protein VK048_07330, partial [Atopostipes sp.]|nr:hypothetical protein [Atopostipes sp.]
MEEDLLRHFIDERKSREFIDRKEPKDLITSEIELYETDKKGKTDYSLLYFHGVGGKGKSELLRIAKENIQNDRPDVHNILWDANRREDSSYAIPSILLNLRNSLVENYNYNFESFDLHISYYYKVKNQTVFLTTFNHEYTSKDYVKSLPKRLINFSAELVSPIDTVRNFFTEFIVEPLNERQSNQTKQEELRRFQEFETLGEEQHIAILLNAFILSLKANTVNLDKPLVIFIDTFEDVYTEDKSWLFSHLENPDTHAKGLLHSIENVIWIIFGRNKLTLDDRQGWDEQNYKNYELEKFTRGYSDEYVEKNIASFPAEDLDVIWNFTEGNPLLLNFLEREYQTHQDQAELLSELSQGYSEARAEELLLARYKRFIIADENQQQNDIPGQLFKIFLCLGTWRPELLRDESFHQFLQGLFHHHEYERYLSNLQNKSYVIQDTDQQGNVVYRIDEKVQAAFLNDHSNQSYSIPDHLKIAVYRYLIAEFVS